MLNKPWYVSSTQTTAEVEMLKNTDAFESLGRLVSLMFSCIVYVHFLCQTLSVTYIVSHASVILVAMGCVAVGCVAVGCVAPGCGVCHPQTGHIMLQSATRLDTSCGFRTHCCFTLMSLGQLGPGGEHSV